MEKIAVRTRAKDQFVNITADVEQLIPPDFDGLCTLFSSHTTAGITINENADPDVVKDILADLRRLVPDDSTYYQHFEGNSSAHLKTSLVGASETIPVVKGKLVLGTWQGIYFCEFDGPRNRTVVVQLTGE